MANEGVKIVVDAENKASAKLKDVAKDVKQVGVDVKEVGDRTKASTEAVGALATAFGGDAIGSFAGELAGLTEKMVAFKEAAGESKGAAIAFKGALALAVGAVAFKVGQAIGDLVFQVERWNKVAEEAAEKGRKLSQAFNSIQARQYASVVSDLEAIEDHSERVARAQEEINALATNMAAKERIVLGLREKLEQRTETLGASVRGMWGEYAKTTEIMQEQLAEAEAQLEAGQAQKQVLLEIATAEEKRLETQKTAADLARESGRKRLRQLQNELELMESQDKIATKIAQEVRAGNMTEFQAGIAETLERKIQNIKDVQAAEKDAKKALVESAKAELKEREEAIKKAEEKAKKEGEATSLSAKGGRLSRTGGVMTSSDKTATNTEKLKEEAKEQSKLLQDVVDRLDALTLAQAQQEVYEVIQA